jgi:hypothetical protein
VKRTVVAKVLQSKFFRSFLSLRVIVFLNLIVLLGAYFFTSEQQKVNIRSALFFQKDHAGDSFRATPNVLKTYGFRDFSLKNQLRFFEKNRDFIDSLGVNKSFSATVEEVKAMVMLFSKNGGIGCGAFSDNLRENIYSVAIGNGCCSDHSQVFMALAIINGISAREVHHFSHTFNEYWDTALKQWVWVDTQYALMARDSLGRYLGLADIYQNMQAGKAVVWEFFGNYNHLFFRQPPEEHLYYQKDQFNTLVMTLGNNVFEVDYYNQKLQFLPRAIRQFFLLSIDIQPSYTYYEGEMEGGQSLSAMLWPYKMIIWTYAGFNVLWLFGWLYNRFGGSKRARSGRLRRSSSRRLLYKSRA